MRFLILAATAVAATLTAAAPADAQVNRRQWQQERAIERGAWRGDLNRREYGRLQRQQARIDRYERRSRWDDGRLSRRERARLYRMQNRADRNIYRQRNDWQGRGYGGYRGYRDYRW
jgi:opacity protein-like surface antigen